MSSTITTRLYHKFLRSYIMISKKESEKQSLSGREYQQYPLERQQKSSFESERVRLGVCLVEIFMLI